MEIILMLQCNNFIHKLEEPYGMDSVIRVTDCMYCRYQGSVVEVGDPLVVVESADMNLQVTQLEEQKKKLCSSYNSISQVLQKMLIRKK